MFRIRDEYSLQYTVYIRIPVIPFVHRVLICFDPLHRHGLWKRTFPTSSPGQARERDVLNLAEEMVTRRRSTARYIRFDMV